MLEHKVKEVKKIRNKKGLCKSSLIVCYGILFLIYYGSEIVSSTTGAVHHLEIPWYLYVMESQNSYYGKSIMYIPCGNQTYIRKVNIHGSYFSYIITEKYSKRSIEILHCLCICIYVKSVHRVTWK